MPNPKNLLETLYGVPMQDGGKLPPGIKRATERAKESKSVLPVAGARQARQAIQGYLGMDPSFSVMDPEAQALESAYRGGETASVLGDLFASLTPFATASALSKANQIPGASMAVKPQKASSDVTRIFHGGRNPNFTEVPKGGIFDGFFGSPSKAAAMSHGTGHNYFADIPKSKILTNYDLNYELPHEKTLQAFTKVTGIKETDPNFESAWKAIVEDQGHKHAADADLFDAVLDDPGWIAQKKRGQLAKELGFQAIEMSDEHGTSYLMTPGVPLHPLEGMNKAEGGAVRKKVRISDNPDTMLLELTRAPRMQDGGSVDQFLGRTTPRGVSALPGYGQGKEDVQQALTTLEESPIGRIASGVGELAEGYMSGAGSTDLQKIGQGLSMIPVLGLPATVSKTIKTARVGDAITDSLRAKYPNVDISVAGDNTLYLGKMVVPKEQRNQGIGTQVMNDLVKQADDIGATVTLSPSADFGGNKEKLKEFYKRFGFVQNTGKNKDFAISESMYRAPQENLPTNFSDLGAMATQAYADYKANPNQLNALRYQRIKKAADDAYVKTQATSSKPVVTDEDYRGLHTAPTRASGAPLHALTQTYPDDIYSSRASQYYGHGEPRDAAVVSLAQSFKGRPHQMVTVYRAVPKNAKGGINAGDWVTIDRPYAKSHGESALRGDYKILSKRVRANEIFTNGDSIYEWGYDPVEAVKKAAGGAVKRVHISDNPDTMRLELLRKKHA